MSNESGMYKSRGAQETFEGPLKKMADRITRTNGGFLISGIFIPFTFNVSRDIDPLAEKVLMEMYDGDAHADCEIIGFTQRPHTIVSGMYENIVVAMNGLYLVSIAHPESESYFVEFVRIDSINSVYEGRREQPSIATTKKLQIYGHDYKSREYELSLIKQTFEWTLEY